MEKQDWLTSTHNAGITESVNSHISIAILGAVSDTLLFVLPIVVLPIVLQVSPISLVGGAFDLAEHAVSHLSSLGLPAGQLAALLVIAGRQSRGLYPVWPKALVVLTGMLHPVGEAQQELLQELVVKAQTCITQEVGEGTVS